MLYTNTINEGSLALLKELMGVSELSKFSLVGGTALSLQFGHRISDDIDLFIETDFDKQEIIAVLEKKFGKRLVYEERGNPLGIFCFMDEVKVDLIKHRYACIRPLMIEENIRMYSTEDIAAMKIATILRRAKKKDFWDIAELLLHYTVDDLVKFFFEKFPQQMYLISIPQAMTFFSDAESDDDPRSLKGQTWIKVKNVIERSVSEYLK
jgi:predicted nucleotidyltransferase component of viral defense system